ncbi:MAG: diacylglycerol kinase family protein, partial [Sphingobacteriales bacterium]
FGRSANFQLRNQLIKAGLLFRLTRIEWACILFCIAMVIAMEMMNSAIEKTCNYMTREISPQIKVIKDISAGAVLICAIVSAIIGMLIFIPYILKLLPVS